MTRPMSRFGETGFGYWPLRQMILSPPLPLVDQGRQNSAYSSSRTIKNPTPIKARSHAELTVSSLVFDTLYTVDLDGKPVPRLALALPESPSPTASPGDGPRILHPLEKKEPDNE